MNKTGKGLFQRLKEKLSKTRHEFISKVDRLLDSRQKIDDQFLEELEEIMVTSDLGTRITYDLIEKLKNKIRRKELDQPEVVKNFLREEIYAILKGEENHLEISIEKPFIIMVIGVNGVGKTTLIGKMASRFASQGKSVILVAADTFRTAAIEQLQVWGKRANVEVVSQQSGSDPAAVVFDALEGARAKKVDIVLIDTAGRMHTKSNLMDELKKIKRVVAKVQTDAPHEILLVLDATTGQNALSQAKQFNEVLGVTGIGVTKLDGTSRGGVLVAISGELNIPLRYIGIGEKIEDLRDFDAREFVNVLL